MTGAALPMLLLAAAVGGQASGQAEPATSSAGTVGQRQSRTEVGDTVVVTGRIAGRIQSRVQSRIRNRIDRTYDPTDAAAAFAAAQDQARVGSTPRR